MMGGNVAVTFEHKRTSPWNATEILHHILQYNWLWDVTKKQQYLSINVEYGKIPVSYFVKLVCMLVVCVARLITSYCIWPKTTSRKYFKSVNALHCTCITINKALRCGLEPNIALGEYLSLAHTLVLYFL